MSVSPTSDSTTLFNYYSKALRDAEDQGRQSEKQTRTQNENQINEIEKHYNSTIRKNEQETDKAIERVKDESSRTLTRERDQNLEKITDMKDTHQKDLRARGTDSERELKRDIRSLQEDLDHTKKLNREQSERETSRLEDSYRADISKKDKGSVETIKNIKDAANESLSKEVELHQAELDRIKGSNYNNRGQFATVPFETYKKDIQELEKNMRAQHAADIKHTEDREEQLNRRTNEIGTKGDNRIVNLTRTHAEQMNDLQGQTRESTLFNERTEKQRYADSMAAIRSTEENERKELQKLADMYDNQIEKLHNNIKDQDSYYQKINQESAHSKDVASAKTVQRLNVENNKTVNELEKTYQSQFGQLMHEKKEDARKSEEKLEGAISRNNANHLEVLENQAHNYEKTMTQMKAAEKNEVGILQKELVQRRTSDDPNLVPPAAESKIRNNIINEYQKAFNQETEKNKANQDEVHRKFTEQYKAALEEFSDKQTRSSQANAQQITHDRNEFVDTVSDIEYLAKEKVNRTNTTHEKENEHLHRQFAHQLIGQKREYENILEYTKADADARLATTRQEASIESKLLQRSLIARQNELIREYEKKLADQKDDSDLKIEEVKAQTKIDIRDGERRAKQDLELQAKGYDQRIAQLEAQFKERERNTTQNHHDEVDRIRRSYEVASKKKS